MKLFWSLVLMAATANAAPPSGIYRTHITPSPWTPPPQPPRVVIIYPVPGGILVRTNQSPNLVPYWRVGDFYYNPYVR
jgi:hypothetical protein